MTMAWLAFAVGAAAAYPFVARADARRARARARRREQALAELQRPRLGHVENVVPVYSRAPAGERQDGGEAA